MDGRVDDKVRLYEAAIAADPELTVAYINLALELSGSGRLEEAREVYDKALNTAPFDADLVRNGFFLRKEKLGDRKGAARFLDEWQAKVGNLDYAFDFVRALDAEADGRLAEAEQHYKNAISKDAPSEVYERHATLRLTKMSDDKVPIGDRLGHITEIMQPLMGHEENADAYLYIGRALRDTLGGGRYAIDYLAKAFDIAPTAEAAAEVFTQMSTYDFEQAQAFLEKAQTILPNNFSMKNSLAWMNYQFLAEPDVAGELALQAFDLAPHDEARLDAIRTFGASRQNYGRFSEAHRFYLERLAHPWTSDFRNRLLMLVTDNLIAAQRFNEARDYLNTMRAAHKGNSGWLDRKTKLVEAAIALESQRTSSEPSPVTAWQNGFDPESPPQVRFALNSHVIPAYAYDVLNRSAQLLRANGSNGLALSIEGYTDTTGSDAGNDALSLRRAEAVRDYLIRKLGVRPEQIRLSAHGSRFPAASNNDHEGRRQNRRVELRALDAASLAGNAFPSAHRGSAFSPDGRYAVFGQSPPQLWDMRVTAKLHDLYRGRDHRFSPDGQYVAAVSSYKEEDGTSTEAVYIYETATGNAIAQLHEPLEIVALAWKPDSVAIAFATADGFLKLYDHESRGYSGITRMGPMRVGGPLTWFPDGNMIAGGQHRTTEIILWDAGRLTELRRLGSVNWPHTLGASPDGRYLLAFDNRLKMSVWDMHRKTAARKTDVPMIPLDLEFHPQGRRVTFNARFEASDISIAVMDYVRMSPVALWSDAGTYMIGLSPGGSTLLAARDERRIEFDSRTLEIIHAEPASAESGRK